ncbi:beta-N-acetylhexosaminidase [Salegentibacter mishustinae]|uniref:beta-N-acetylhexosaminidase n=1 Tax=Salegentibacter mishustinae TaxID=270918 RepID=A0A0Q9ZC20_9FLAO|nr:family 20 glycosylhydrolase [Salegentibacter mishustinae]KRG27602.1 beta-N-acetylhexosaminidase [Salegentibacter mishustinae]PNW20340.1 beta-N-acetylhexosaminidase [Salegentibacter mishustinae]PZX63130.1 hexosaminidase [Salegentibacter mishustinae]GGW92058.1 beta-hexosaminidase [Salegentibacter mishustinae]
MKYLYYLLYFPILVFSACSGSKEKTFSENELNLIPFPKELKLNEGSFNFTKETSFVVEGTQQKEIAELLNSKFSAAAGWEMAILEEKPQTNFIQFKENKDLNEEAYKLLVEDEKIIIEAASSSGFIYAIETLRQLLPVEIESTEKVNVINWQIPQIEISDEPRFEWRGLMLDVSRHFFEKEYIFKTIDRLAFLKMNTLHLHLVDDQGWRIEIKKYPKLTEVGAFRVDQEDKHWDARSDNKPGEEASYGGFYTQKDIKQIVAYAAKHGIKVVPEIEMPAHVTSAIAAYPELSCTGKPVAVPSGGVWPITDIYCAGKEETFEFLENVLLEVIKLFPSKYIHVGGDEATKTEWEKCEDCQRRIREEGLAGVDELQSYFIRRMEEFLSSHDRVLIGWDEILEGGLAPGAKVMSWRGTEGGWEASEEGHDVIMTPGSHVYFNFYQGDFNTEPMAFSGFTPLNKVYEFDPVVDSMNTAQKKYVLGGQANLWSEFIDTPELSEYMLFPRLVALSEVLWIPEDKKDWADFSRRLHAMFKRLDLMDINYATSAYSVTAESVVDSTSGKIKIALKNEFPNSEIRYTLNDKNLNASSPLYKEPVAVDKSSVLRAAVYENGKPKGDTLVKDFHFHKAVGKKVSYKPKYNDNYTGVGKSTTVNVIRATKNFHDGQWLGWLGEDVEVIIDLEKSVQVESLKVGTMENQGSGIYFPVKISAFASKNGEEYSKIGEVSRDFKTNGAVSLKDFEINVKLQEVKCIKVKIDTYKGLPGNGKAWLFVDEIMIE